jgi:N-acyl homoserine lactone hydrolase
MKEMPAGPTVYHSIRVMWSLALGVVLFTAAGPASAGTVDRLYAIDCGWAHAPDQSRWSPGVNVSVPIDVSNNCYLIHHSNAGYLLWDTGITDRLASLPEGQTAQATGQTWYRTRTLARSLEELGVKSSDIRAVAVSHVHPDHTGNLGLFPEATLIVQRAEWEYGLGLPFKPFNGLQKTQLLDGDADLFGDGTVTVLSTPGHTPGHQSLVVRLEKSGVIVLSGDAVHFQSNWDNRRVPVFNTDRAQSLKSMEKIARILAEQKATLWINHDKPSSDARRHAPEYYE